MRARGALHTHREHAASNIIKSLQESANCWLLIYRCIKFATLSQASSFVSLPEG